MSEEEISAVVKAIKDIVASFETVGRYIRDAFAEIDFFEFLKVLQEIRTAVRYRSLSHMAQDWRKADALLWRGQIKRRIYVSRLLPRPVSWSRRGRARERPAIAEIV